LWEGDEVAEQTTLKEEFLDDYYFLIRHYYDSWCCCWDYGIVNPSYSGAVIIGKILFLAVLGVARYLIGIDESFS